MWACAVCGQQFAAILDMRGHRLTDCLRRLRHIEREKARGKGRG